MELLLSARLTNLFQACGEQRLSLVTGVVSESQGVHALLRGKKLKFSVFSVCLPMIALLDYLLI